MKLKNQFGFSMIEIMITVAIIGIGATMAAPSYNALIAKSRQSEARTELSQIYMKEKSYFAEFGRYTSCLWQAGYNPAPGAMRFYGVGYLNGGTTGMYRFGGAPEPQTVDPIPYSLPCTCGTGNSWGGSNRNDCTFSANSFANPSVNGTVSGEYIATKTYFNAIAWGSISGARVVDVWTINDQKVNQNIQSGM